MRAQVGARAIGALVGLEATINPLQGSTTYSQVADLPLEERIGRLADPDVRQQVLAELAGRLRYLDRLFELGDPPNYEPDPSTSIAARASSSGESPDVLLYDLLLTRGGTALLYMPVLNYSDGNLDAVAEMMDHPHTVPGLGDGGAHVGTICDASFATTLLAFWGRDRPARRFEVPWLIQRQCRATALAVGLADRGLIAAGYKADVNVIDFEQLRLEQPTIAHDLPAGGKRLLQTAHGYRHTVVSGVETYTDGHPTGALPGRLVRGGRSDPSKEQL
jgi:N-acyl-D-aspartate/D-glutamate deacylase